MGKNTKFKSRGNHNVRASRATRTQDAAAQELALASDSSLDEGLRDYLSNINQVGVEASYVMCAHEGVPVSVLLTPPSRSCTAAGQQ